MILISADSSTKKSGLTLFEDGEYKEHILIDYSKEKDVETRINKMGKDILSYLIKHKPDIIVCEHPQGSGRNVSMVGKLCEVIGMMRAYAVQKNIEFHELMPSEWRSYLSLPQGSKKRDELKQLSIDYVQNKYGIIASDDEADSICIGDSYIQHCNSY